MFIKMGKAYRVVNSLLEFRTNLRDIIFAVIASPLFPVSQRWRIYRMMGLRIEKCGIAGSCFFGSRRIAIGSGTFVNYQCFFDGSAATTIGKNCNIGYQVMLASSSHSQGNSSRRAGQANSKPIVIGDGVWLGARATIIGGVTVGRGVVVAAGSVVVRDCDPDTLYAGVPARKIRAL